MTDQHTPGPWSQGVTLNTRETRRWSPEETATNDVRERLMVFSGFTPLDEGRGRRRVAICDRPEDARLIAKAPEMRDMLLELFEDPDVQLALGGNPNRIQALIERALALVDDIKGG